MVGFGPGGVPCDLELFGVEPQDAGLMNLESMDMVLGLWRAEAPFELAGKYWNIKIEKPDPNFKMGNMLRPFQQPHPPIALSIIKPESMGATTAGERGYIPITANAMTLQAVRHHWELYCDGAAKANQPQPSRDVWRVCRSIFVGETEKDAWEFARAGYSRSYDYLLKILKAGGAADGAKISPDMTDDDVTVDYLLEKVCIIGTVEQCSERLQEAVEITGGFGHLLMVSQDADDDPRWAQSVELLATEVLPAVNKFLR